MDDNFILRILLKARDDMSPVLARAKAELAAFTDQGELLERRADTLNRRLDTLNRRMDTFAKRGDSIRQSLGVANIAADDFDDRVNQSVKGQKEEEKQTLATTDAIERRAKAEKALADLKAKTAEVETDLLKVQRDIAENNRLRLNQQKEEAEGIERAAKASADHAEALTKQAVAEETLRQQGMRTNEVIDKQIASDEKRQRALELSRRAAANRKNQAAGEISDSKKSQQAILDEAEARKVNAEATEAEADAINKRTKAVKESKTVLPPAGRDVMTETRGERKQRERQARVDSELAPFLESLPETDPSNRKEMMKRLGALRGELSRRTEEFSTIKRQSAQRKAMDVMKELNTMIEAHNTEIELLKDKAKEEAKAQKVSEGATKANEERAVTQQTLRHYSKDYDKALSGLVIAEEKLAGVKRMKAGKKNSKEDLEFMKAEAQERVENARLAEEEARSLAEHEYLLEKETKATKKSTEATKDRTSAKREERDVIKQAHESLSDLLDDPDSYGEGHAEDDFFDPLLDPGIPGIGGGATGPEKEEEARRKRDEARIRSMKARLEAVKQAARATQKEFREGDSDSERWIDRLQAQLRVLGRLQRSLDELEFGDSKTTREVVSYTRQIRQLIDKYTGAQGDFLADPVYGKGARGAVPLSMRPASIQREIDKRASEIEPEETEQVDKHADALRRLSASAEEVSHEYENFINNVDRGNMTFGRQRVYLEQYRNILNKLARDYARDPETRMGSMHLRLAEQANDAGEQLGIVNRRIKEGGESARDADRGFGTLSNRLRRFELDIRRSGQSVAMLDNQLRGLMVLAILTFAQQFSTILIGLAGALTAVAGSALMAAGALGGAFAAGLVSAIPMIGLVIASLAKLKSIMDAVQQSDMVELQNFQRRNDNQKKAASTADAVANAQDGLRSANESLAEAHKRVADAQRGVTDAREQARAEILKLIQAERDAELAARGAAISQGEAQDRLRASIASGDISAIAGDQLGVDESRNARLKAEKELQDARLNRMRAQRAGINGSYVDASGTRHDQVQQAVRGLQDAKRAADNAARGVERAQRGIESARRGAAEAAADQFSALEKLDYMLKQMSPAERRLYRAIQNIRDTYKKNFSEITDILVNEYANYVNTTDNLLKQPGIKRGMREMADDMAFNMRRIRQSFTDSGTIDQFLNIFENGSAALDPFTDSVDNLGHAFLNISEAAGPTLQRILEYFSDFTGDVREFTEDQDKMEAFFDRGTDHLLAWLDLLGSIINLFAALTGAGEGTGLEIVEDTTNWMNRQADNIRNNGEQTQKFFQDSKRVLYTILHVLGDVAKAMMEIFDPERVETMAKFFEDVLLPSLVSVTKLMGRISDAVLKLTEIPVVGWLVGIILKIALFMKVAGGIRMVLIGVGGTLAKFGTIVAKTFELTAINKFIGRVGFLGTLLGKLGLGRLFGVGGAAGAAATAANPMAILQKNLMGGAAGAEGAAKTGLLSKATSLGKTFWGKFGGAIKGIGWTHLGFSAIEGIMSAFKHGSVGAGIRDFVSSATFGLVKSTEEVAAEAVDRINKTYREALDETPIPKPGSHQRAVREGDAHRGILPDKEPAYQQRMFDLGTYRYDTGIPLTPEQRQNAAAQGSPITTAFEEKKTPLQDVVDKLRAAGKDEAADAYEEIAELYDKLEEATRRKDVLGINIVNDRIASLRDKFGKVLPEATSMMDAFADRTERSMKRVAKALAPETIAKGFAANFLQFPKKWRGAVDDTVHEIKKLDSPAARRHAYQAAQNVIDQAERAREITPKKALMMRVALESQYDKLLDNTREKSQKIWGGWMSALSASVRASSLAGHGILRDMNDMLVQLGAGKGVKAANNAGEVVGQITNLAGTLFRNAGGPVPGWGDSDTVKARLTPGEHVWTKDEVARAGGHGAMFAMRRFFGGGTQGGPSHYAKGGIVGIPWQPGEEIAASILPLVTRLHKKYRFIVTDAFDRDLSAGHKSPGHNVTGTAVDAVPQSPTDAGWNLLESLGRWAVKQGLTVGYGAGVPGSQAWPGHGRGQHMHIEFAANMAASLAETVGNLLKKIKTPKFDGLPDGQMKRLLNRVGGREARAAREFVRKKADGMSQDGPYSFGGKLSAGPNGAKIFEFFKKSGFSDNQAAAWVGNFVQESGLNPAAVQAGGPGRGLAQWGGGRFVALQNFAKERGTSWTNLRTQLEFVMHELHGPESVAFQAIKAAKTLKEAVDAVGLKYERFGIAGDRYGPAQQALNQYGKKFEIGGDVPGKGPFPAVLHGGEHVWTAKEVLRAGGHGVMYALRALLGGGTQGTGGAYAKGGKVNANVLQIGDSLSVGIEEFLRKWVKDLTADTKKSRRSDQAFEILKDKLKKVYTDVIFDVGTNDHSAQTLARNLRKARRLLGDDQNLIISTVHGPKAKAKNEVIREFAERHENVSLVNAGPLKKGRADDGIHYTPEGYKIRAGMFRDAIGGGGGGPAYNYAEQRKQGLYQYPILPPRGMADLQHQFQLAMRAMRNLRKGGDFEKRIDKFVKNIDNIAGDGKLLDTISAGVDSLTTRLSTQLSLASVGLKRKGLRIVQRGPKKGFHPLGPVDQADMAIDNAERIYNAMENVRKDTMITFRQNERRIKRIREHGVTDKEKRAYKVLITAHNHLLDSLGELDTNMAANRQEFYEKQVEKFEAQAAKHQKKVDLLQSVGNFFSRIGSTLGNYTAQALGATLNIQAIATQGQNLQTELTKAINKAKKDPRWKTKVDEILGQIMDNTASMIEAVAAQVEAFMTYVDTYFQRKYSRIDSADRYADLAERRGNTLGAGRMRLSDTRMRRGVQDEQMQFLQSALAAARARGDVGMVDKLQDQIVDLSVTIAETEQTIKDLIASNHSLSLSIQQTNKENTVGFINAGMTMAQKLQDIARQVDPTKMLPYLRMIAAVLQQGAQNIVNEVMSAINDEDNPFGANSDFAETILNAARAAFQQGPEVFSTWLAENAQSLADVITMLGPDTPAGQLFQQLIDAMIENTTGVLDNTQAIEDATGGQELQGFTTTAWEMFRTAIFDGLGGLMPEYTIPQMYMGGTATKAGIFDRQPGESALAQNVAAKTDPSGDIFNIPITKPVENADPDVIARKIAWVKKNRGR